jgi:hypothetical protein
MESENKIEYYEPGTVCYIGTPDASGRRNIRGEIDHIRIFYKNHIVYSVRYWDETNIKYCLCERNEIYVEEKTAEQAMGFAAAFSDKSINKSLNKKDKI